jgi:hypothetical protein
MEGVLEKSVQQAALRLNEQLQRVSPDLIQLAGAAHARGYRLEGYGLFFDVEVPAAMRQTMGWTARVMRQQHEGVSEALGALKRIASELDPRSAPRSARCGDRAGRPAGPARRPRSADGAAPRGWGHGASTSTVKRRRRPLPTATSPDRRAAAGEADALPWRSPDLAYEDQVREALIGAMLDWGALLPLGPDEWLTVAARDNQDVVMPGAAPDVVTIILRVKAATSPSASPAACRPRSCAAASKSASSDCWRCAPGGCGPRGTFRALRIHDSMRRAWLLIVLLAGLGGSIACRSEPDASEALKVTDVVTGWLDKGIVDGQNKLVPTISLKVRNGADRSLSYLQLNAVFRIVDDTEELGSKVIWATHGEDLGPAPSVRSTRPAISATPVPPPAPRCCSTRCSRTPRSSCS